MFVRSVCHAAALTLCLCLAAPALAQELREIPVDESFSRTNLKWASRNGQMDVAWKVQNHGGRVHVCGAISHSNARAQGINPQALRRGWVKLDGKKVLKGLSFFTDTGLGGDLDKARARCKPTPVKEGNFTFFLGFDPVRVIVR